MLDWSQLLFALIFVGQIIYVSHHLPSQVAERMQAVLTRYPAASYPRLYVVPSEYYQTALILYRAANWAVIALGFLMLALVLYTGGRSDDGAISEAWPIALGAFQFLPLILLELMAFRHYRKMRRDFSAKTRRASLTPRRLLQHVSPWLLALAVLAVVVALSFDYYFNGADMPLKFALLFANVYFLALGAWMVYGRRPDPHQDPGDRQHVVSVQLRMMAYTSILLSVFSIYWSADQVYDLDVFDAPLMSLYVLAIAWLASRQFASGAGLDDLNFEVYREEPLADGA